MSLDDSSTLISRIETLAEDDADHTAELLGFLEHPAAPVREASVWALWSGTLSAILEPLLSLVELDPDESVRAAAVSVLGRFVYEGLMLEAADETTEVAGSIRRVRDWLRALLHDATRPELLRRRALESLSFDADAELEKLVETWSRSPDELYRKSAAFAMGRIDDERFTKHLLKALDDESPMVQIEAIRSVGELGTKKALPKLIALTKGADDELAGEAIQALGQIGGAKAVAALKAMKKEGDKARAQLAREALEELDEDA